MGRLTAAAAATITGLLLLTAPAYAQQSGIERVFNNAERIFIQIGSSILLVVAFFVAVPLLARSKVGGIIVLLACTILLGGLIVSPEAWWNLIEGTTDRLLRGT